MGVVRVGIAELKDRLSEHLRRVEAGSELVIMDRHRPIARVVRLQPAEPLAQVVPATRKLQAADRRAAAPARWPVSSLDLLREERGDR